MKRWSTAVALAALLTTLPSSAKAAELPTHALVDIISSINVVEDTPLDFGGLILSDGSVTVSPSGLVTADVNNLVAAPTQTAGSFTISSMVGAQIEISFTTPSSTNGLSLSDFAWSIRGNTSSPVEVTQVDEVMTLGATLTVNTASALVGNNQQIPYTVTVAFP